MRVLVSCLHPRGAAAAERLKRKGRAFLRALGRDDAELSVALVCDRRIRGLNRDWRGKDAATDVLSFPQDAAAGPLLGDVVISLDTAARAAREDGRTLEAELDRYLAHGLLHLLGHDHEKPAQARRMAAAEEALLEGEGMVGAATRKPPRAPSARAGTRQGAERKGAAARRRVAGARTRR